MPLVGFCMGPRRAIWLAVPQKGVHSFGRTRCCAGVSRGGWRRACAAPSSAGDLLLGMLPSRPSPLPPWAFPAFSQRDSGFPTELAAARHPGPCPGNTTWFLHRLLLAPGYHPEEQRYRARHSPGASGGRDRAGLLVQYSSPRVLGSLPLLSRWPASA